MNPYYRMEISCDFGERINPITKEKEFHRGQDFLSNDGNTYAGVPGIIKLREQVFDKKNKNWEYGKFYQLQFYADGILFFSNIAHNKEFIAQKGKVLQPDTIIALQGSTGLSTGPHIHYEIFSYMLQECGELIDFIPSWETEKRIFFRPLDIFLWMDKE
jgi:murein DD-endopeptidase MepM/ murein hydrolase activator NlpD